MKAQVAVSEPVINEKIMKLIESRYTAINDQQMINILAEEKSTYYFANVPHHPAKRINILIKEVLQLVSQKKRKIESFESSKQNLNRAPFNYYSNSSTAHSFFEQMEDLCLNIENKNTLKSCNNLHPQNCLN